MSELELTGGCQCGAVRYRARVANTDAYACHCSMCRRAYGAPYSAFFNLPKEKVTWEKGAPAKFASSKIAARGFCRDCGTPLTFAYHDSKNMDVSIGSLDEPEKLTPVMNVGVESRLDAWSNLGGLPDKRTEDLQHVVDKWEKAYGQGKKPGET